MGQNENTGASQRSNKTLIIAIIVAAAVLVTLLIVRLATKPRATSTTNTSLSVGTQLVSNDVAEKFNTFANFALYGTNSSDKLSESYDGNKTYYLKTAIDEDPTATYEKAEELFNRLEEAYEASREKTDYGADYLSNFKTYLEFVSAYAKIKTLSDDKQILTYLSKNGLDATLAQFDKIFATLSDQYSDYKTLASSYYNSLVVYLNQYVSAGCVANGEIISSNECSARLNGMTDLKTRPAAIDLLRISIIENRVFSEMNYLFWTMNNEFYNGVKL